MDDDRAKEFVYAICLQAIKDYRAAYKQHKINFVRMVRLKNAVRNPRINHELKETKNILREDEKRMKEIEDFFNSPWGTTCAGYPGEVTIRAMRERLEDDDMDEHEGIWGSL